MRNLMLKDLNLKKYIRKWNIENISQGPNKINNSQKRLDNNSNVHKNDLKNNAK